MKGNRWILVWDTLNFQKMLVAHFSSKMPTGSHDYEVTAQSITRLAYKVHPPKKRGKTPASVSSNAVPANHLMCFSDRLPDDQPQSFSVGSPADSGDCFSAGSLADIHQCSEPPIMPSKGPCLCRQPPARLPEASVTLCPSHEPPGLTQTVCI